jgi:hypothetical protein
MIVSLADFPRKAIGTLEWDRIFSFLLNAALRIQIDIFTRIFGKLRIFIEYEDLESQDFLCPHIIGQIKFYKLEFPKVFTCSLLLENF